MNNDHLSPNEIEAYVNYQFEGVENDRIILHLSECDMCLTQADLYWTNEGHPDQNLDDRKLKKRLMHHINRSNLIGNFIQLGVNGILSAISGLLVTILKVNTTRSTRTKQ